MSCHDCGTCWRCYPEDWIKINNGKIIHHQETIDALKRENLRLEEYINGRKNIKRKTLKGRK